MNESFYETIHKGSAGSLHLSCPVCGRDRFREFVENIEWETCLSCGAQMEFVLIKDLKSKWKPIWENGN